MFTLARGLTDQGRIDAIESELRPAEEVEGSISADIAPGQAEVALPAWTEDEGAAEVQSVVHLADGDIDLPAGGLRIPRHWVEDTIGSTAKVRR